MRPTPIKTGREAEQGYMLVGLIVAIFIILLVIGIAAPTMAKQLRRDREVEAVHRGNQYVRAVQVYYRKVGHYPGSIEQLEKTNNVRFLRQRYADPMTGKPDWKLIHVGEAKTTVKGFFGQPLMGLNTGAGMGSAASSASSGTIGAGAAGSSSGSSTFGSSSFGSSGSSSASGTSSGSSFGSSSFSSGTGSSSGTVGAGSGSSTGVSSQSATSFTGTGAPIMGVRSAAAGESIIVLNEQKTYPTWEFIYDPRIEQLKAKASLLGGGPSSTSASGFGSGSASSFGSGSATGASSTGSTSTFGSSSFGSSSGSSGSSGTSTGTTTTPQ